MSRQRDELQEIPGIGPSLAIDLHDLGYRRVADLKDEDPQKMYDRLIKLRRAHQDRCVLYVFRCAVYYAGRAKHDPEKLKWWNWSDANLAARR
jgi:hypothetical protein